MARLIYADINVITFHTECSNLYVLSTPCHLAAASITRPFAKLRKANISFDMSVRTHGTRRPLVDFHET
jgi:hypothetical protein